METTPNGMIAFDDKLAYFDGTGYVDIADIVEQKGSEKTVGTVEAKVFGKEVIKKFAGYVDMGEWEFTVLYEASQSAQLESLLRVDTYWRRTKPDETIEYFTGFLSKFGREIGDGEGVLKNNIAITIKGDITEVDPAV